MQSSTAPLEVTYLRTTSLKPDPRNPRVHSDKQIRQIAQSIESFGFNVPLLIDDQQMVIAGHGRLLAARKLGWENVPAIRLSHLTESQRTAFLIADNRLTENSSWDERMLGEQLKNLSELELDFDLEAIGFEVPEIDLLIDGLNTVAEADPDDRLPEISGSAVTVFSDLWQLGKHRVLCGNSLVTGDYTQQFNTTNSMGRLTLNVLLSFAQFEREVTGERIRDKVAASKKKGMWMGGHVPKGYDRVEGKLIVNIEEAIAVRNIFFTYLECGCVRKLAERLKHSGIRSKRWTSSTGRQRGGVILSRGSLYHTLNNPIYIGKIAHQGKLHDGQHEPILDLQIWNQVAAMLKDNRVARRTQGNIPSGRLLHGKLMTSDGQRYTPTHAAKKGRRYFYYILTGSGRGSSVNTIKRLPADELESRVLSSIGSFLEDSPRLAGHFKTLDVKELRLLTSAAKHRSAELSEIAHANTRDLISRIVRRIVVDNNELCIFLSHAELCKDLLGEVLSADSSAEIQLHEPISIARRGSAVKLILSNGERESAAPIASLVRAVVQARTWSEWIVAGKVRNLEELAAKASLNKRYASRILRLAALSPTLYEAILAGNHSPLLTVSILTKDLPLEWKEQHLAE